jgi:membrane protein DedA with SNARE-associated domain
MSVDSLTELILQYRYWILIPLSLVEGPVVAFVAGTLAAVGYFNIYFLAVLFFIRDVGLDGVYYAIGHFGGRTVFAERMLKKIGITDDHLENVRVLWERRPGWTMFIGKLSYGIASAFIVVAGMVKMPLGKFFAYGSLVAVLQYGTLLLLGYFLGTSLGGSVAEIINNVQYVIAFAAIAISVYYIVSWRMRQKFLKEDKEIEAEPAEGEPPV